MSSCFISTWVKPQIPQLVFLSLITLHHVQTRDIAPTYLPPYVAAQNQWGTDLLLPVVRQRQVVVSTLGLLVVIHEGVQVRKVAVQIYFSEVSPAHQVSVEFGPLSTHRQNLFQGTSRLLFPIRVTRCCFQTRGLQRNLQLSFHRLSWKGQFFPNSFKRNIRTIQTRDTSKFWEQNWISFFYSWLEKELVGVGRLPMKSHLSLTRNAN